MTNKLETPSPLFQSEPTAIAADKALCEWLKQLESFFLVEYDFTNTQSAKIQIEESGQPVAVTAINKYKLSRASIRGFIRVRQQNQEYASLFECLQGADIKIAIDNSCDRATIMCTMTEAIAIF